MKSYTSFGLAVADNLNRRRITKKELAQAVNCSQPMLSMLLVGDAKSKAIENRIRRFLDLEELHIRD